MKNNKNRHFKFQVVGLVFGIFMMTLLSINETGAPAEKNGAVMTFGDMALPAGAPAFSGEGEEPLENPFFEMTERNLTDETTGNGLFNLIGED